MTAQGGIGGFLGLETTIEREQSLHPEALRLSVLEPA